MKLRDITITVPGFLGRDFTITLLGFIGFGVGVGIILWRAQSTPDSQRFISSPEFFVWLLLIGAQTALWFAIVIPLVELWRTLSFDKRILPKCGLYLLGVMLLFAESKYSRPVVHPLAYQTLKMPLISFIGSIAGTLAIVGIWLVQAASERMECRLESGAEHTKEVKIFLDLQTKLERFLLAAGIIIGAATLATGGLRNATLAYEKTAPFPRENVLLYGMFFSGLLALIYVPAYASLSAVRSALHDAMVPIPETPPDSWNGWYSDRKAVGELLQVQSGPIASFTNGVSILTPLAASLVAILLGANK
jgi:hypothetical protein